MIKVRPAAWADRDVFWDWYTEPIRHLIFGTQPVATIEAHHASLRELLRDDAVVLFIAMVDNLRVGIGRADCTAAGEYDISLYLKPAYCGRGYMAEFVRAATAYLESSKQARRLSMTASAQYPEVIRMFVESGYQPRNADTTVRLEYVCGTRGFSQ